MSLTVARGVVNGTSDMTQVPSGYYFSRGNCTQAERERRWSVSCPRCEEVPGAGVCPAPGTLSDFVRLFNHTYVLCFGTRSCPRHRQGYWPRDVHERMTVLDGHELDAKLGQRLGPFARSLLGIGDNQSRPTHSKRGSLISRKEAHLLLKKERDEDRQIRTLQHRMKQLLAVLEIIELAHSAGLPNVLVLEGDVRPVSKFSLSASEVSQFDTYLRENAWEVVRPSAYFQEFGWASPYSSRPRRTTCLGPCNCTIPTGLDRACLVRRAEHLESRCDVRDTVAFAVHSRAFQTFRSLRQTALDALFDADCSNSSARRLYRYGIPGKQFDLAFPWFDIWLPTRFDSLYVLPSIVVQQVKQGDEKTSLLYLTKCTHLRNRFHNPSALSFALRNRSRSRRPGWLRPAVRNDSTSVFRI